MFCPRCNNNVNNNAKYCTKCGNFLGNNVSNGQNNFNNIPYQNMNNQNRNTNMNNYYQNNHNKKKNNTMLISICSLAGVLLFVIVIYLFINRGSYFFIFENNQSGNWSFSSRNKYKTSVVTDNFYDNVTINSVSDAKNLIVKDSVSQKGNCPSEIKKIEDDMIKKYNITAVNLCELDIDIAKELSNVLHVIYTEYPSAKNYLTNLSLHNRGRYDDENTYAEFYAFYLFAEGKSKYPKVYKAPIHLYANYYLNIDKLELDIKNCVSIGHFPPNASIYSVLAHELGHYLSYIAVLKENNVSSFLVINDYTEYKRLLNVVPKTSDNKFSKNLINTAYQRYIKDTNSTYTFDQFRGTISKYALSKDEKGNYLYDETIAEAFHDVYLNKDNAKPASKYIVQVLKEKVNG